MKKHVLVLYEKKTIPQRTIEEYLNAHKLLPVWCETDFKVFVENKDLTNLILFYLPEEIDNDVRMLLFYLRDICLDEEKVVYLVGSREAFKQIEGIIPKLFIAAKYDRAKGKITDIIDRINADIIQSEGSRCNVLMVDEELSFFHELQLPLAKYFNIRVMEPRFRDLYQLLEVTDILFLGIHFRMSVIEHKLLFERIEKKQREKKLKLVFVADDKDDQHNVNMIKAQSVLCIAKSTPLDKVINYIVNRYSSYIV